MVMGFVCVRICFNIFGSLEPTDAVLASNKQFVIGNT